MQDEIVARLASQLGTQFIAAEARRAELAPHPDSMDLYFQGMASVNKGFSPEYVAQARGFFERALELDPGNIEALVGVGIIDLTFGPGFLSDDRAARLANAEAVGVRAISLAPNHPMAHLLSGVIKIFTNRGVQGIAECERALVLDRNLADAHAWIGLGKYFIARAMDTEAHILEALRLSPRDIFAFRWMWIAGLAKFQRHADVEAAAWMRRSIEANPNQPIGHFLLGALRAQLGLPDEAQAATQSGLALAPGFTIQRFLAGGSSDNPIYLASRVRLCDGLRKAGVPEA